MGSKREFRPRDFDIFVGNEQRDNRVKLNVCDTDLVRLRIQLVFDFEPIALEFEASAMNYVPMAILIMRSLKVPRAYVDVDWLRPTPDRIITRGYRKRHLEINCLSLRCYIVR